MHYYQEPEGDFNDNLPKRTRNTRVKKGLRKRHKLTRGTKVTSLVFTLLATFIGSNIAIYAANTYYNLDTGEVVVDSVQRVVKAIQADGGIVINGTGNSLEVASGNIRFSSTSSTTRIDGRVGIGGAAHATHRLSVTGSSLFTGTAQFTGAVSGIPATAGAHFVTLSQLTSGGDGGVGIDIGVMSLNGLQGALSITGQTGVITITPNSPNIQIAIQDGGINTARLADNAVTSAKIGSLQVTEAKIAAGAVTNAKIGSNAVATGNIADLAVTTDKLAAGAVVTAKIGDKQVTNAKLQYDGFTINTSGAITVNGGSTFDAKLGPTGTVNLAVDVSGVGEGLSGTFFKEGGNTFSKTGAAVLGNIDNRDLSIVTNNQQRMLITSAGAGVTGSFSVSGTTTLSGATTVGGNISLSGGARTIATTGGALNISASGTNTIRLASGSTGNIEFFNNTNFVTAAGNLTISGNFNMSGLAITNSGGLVTLNAPGGMVLNGGTNGVTVNGQLLVGANDYDLSTGSVIREVIPIFKYEIPVQCDTNCSTTPIAISNILASNVGGAAKTGSTREYRVTVKYSGGGAGNNLTWNVIGTGTTSNFQTTGTASTSTEAVFTSGPLNLGTGTWELGVQKPASGTAIQVSQVFLTVIDKY